MNDNSTQDSSDSCSSGGFPGREASEIESNRSSPTPTDQPELTDILDYEDYYDLVGLSQDASQEKVKKHCRKAVASHHPDHSTHPPEVADEIFIRVKEAKDVLSNPSRRKEYNRLGHNSYISQAEELGMLPYDPGIGDRGQDTTTTKEGPIEGLSPEEVEEKEDVVTAAGYGNTQVSVWGKAARNGNPILADDGSFFTLEGTSFQEESEPEPDSFSSVHGGRSFSTRSIDYIERIWGRQWRMNGYLSILFGGLIVSLLYVLSQDSAISSAPINSSAFTPQTVFVMLFGPAIFYTVASGVQVRRKYPRGIFVDDRNTRFNRQTASAYLRRATILLVIGGILALLAAMEGFSPWAVSADVFRGDFPSGSSPLWTQFEQLGIDPSTTGLQPALSVLFIFSFLFGVLYFCVGATLRVWYDYYVEGFFSLPSFSSLLAILTIGVSVCALVFGLTGGSTSAGFLPTSGTSSLLLGTTDGTLSFATGVFAFGGALLSITIYHLGAVFYRD